MQYHSKMVVDGLTLHLPRWEDRGWTGIANVPLLKDAVARLRARSAPTSLQWVKGHSDIPGNDGADVLAKRGADDPPLLAGELPAPNTDFLAKGCKLSSLTQRLAYKAIKKWIPALPRRQTEILDGRITAALREDWNTSLRPGAIWKALRHDDVRRSLRDFWWKALHGALKIGPYWDNIPGYEQRASCTHCAVPETLEHIWRECDAPGSLEIWKCVQDLFRRAQIDVPQLCFAALLAAPALSIKSSENKIMTGRTRLAEMGTQNGTTRPTRLASSGRRVFAQASYHSGVRYDREWHLENGPGCSVRFLWLREERTDHINRATIYQETGYPLVVHDANMTDTVFVGTVVHRARLTISMGGMQWKPEEAATGIGRVGSISLASGYHRATGSSARLRRCFRCLCSGSSLKLAQRGGTVADPVSRKHVVGPRQASYPHKFPPECSAVPKVKNIDLAVHTAHGTRRGEVIFTIDGARFTITFGTGVPQ
ncbi:hypothetical protein VTO73DRAFT_2195 [Trametes versicolor]